MRNVYVFINNNLCIFIYIYFNFIYIKIKNVNTKLESGSVPIHGQTDETATELSLTGETYVVGSISFRILNLARRF